MRTRERRAVPQLSVVFTFGAPQDVTTDKLRIGSFLPADEPRREFLQVCRGSVGRGRRPRRERDGLGPEPTSKAQRHGRGEPAG